MIRILNAEALDYSPIAREILRGLGNLEEADLHRPELFSRLTNTNVLIVRLRSQIDHQVIDSAPRLKVIVTATTGLDHIDTAYAAQRGIAVLSLKGEINFLRSIPATAEHTWGLLLALVRNLPWAYQSVLQGEWERDLFRGRDLSGRHLGIVGLGRIGEKIARYGQAFGMKVAAYDPYRQDWLPDVQHHQTLESLCRQSEILSLHVPLNEETRGMFGPQELSWLPTGAVLVNTARGAILDEIALLKQLKNSQLSGAALDVLSDETTTDKTVRAQLIEYAQSHANLLLTPHIGGATLDSMHATEIFMAQKLKRFLENQIQ
jgi:D-3-phosphoglycerate dehydrogenase / 2-oxoglutarate reductase